LPISLSRCSANNWQRFGHHFER